MRVIFLGTPEFAAGILERLALSRHQITAVITQPDRMNARGNRVEPPAAKLCAQKLGIPVYQFEKISRELDTLQGIDGDIMVTAAYGQILSREVLKVKRYGVINAHASLLPRYRGSSPVQWALINGETETGVTIMQTAYEVDSGDIILTKKLSLADVENATDCLAKLVPLAADALIEALDQIENGTAAFTPQNVAMATFTRFLTKDDGLLDFNKTATEVFNLVRGVTAWPSAYTNSERGILKFIKVQAIDAECGTAGEILTANPKEGLIIKCGKGAIRVVTLQGEGGKAMAAADYLRGKSLTVGWILK